MDFSLQPQTLVILDMAVSMSASKETITNQSAPVLLITSCKVTERPAKVLESFILTELLCNVHTNEMHKMAKAQDLILSKYCFFQIFIFY